MDVPGRIRTLDELTALFGAPSERAVAKELTAIDPGMAAFIDRSPFLVLATADGRSTRPRAAVLLGSCAGSTTATSRSPT